MRQFNYRSEALRLLDFQSVNQIGGIYGFTDRHALAKNHVPDMLLEMKKLALIHNICSGLKLENRSITKDRIVELVLEGSPATTYDEQLVLGYRKAFESINSGSLEQDDLLTAAKKLHILFFSEVPGKQTFWRSVDEPVYLKSQEYQTKHLPIPAKDVPEAFKHICNQCEQIPEDKTIHIMYIIPVFLVDMLYIQPFDKETTFLIWLLLLHILHNAGIPILEYTPLMQLPCDSMINLYFAIEKGLVHWDDEINDYRPAFDSFMEIMDKSCICYAYWISSMGETAIIKQKIIGKYIKIINREVTKQMVRNFCVDVSEPTISLALAHLLRDGKIKKLNRGRATTYKYIGE